VRFALLAAPFVFGFAFVRGYLLQDSSRGAPLIAVLAVVAVASAAAPLMIATPRMRVWGAINLCGALVCAYGMLDNVFHHSSYSGYGALLLAPVAALCALSMLVCAALASPA
jgi:hypothetical protein